MGRSWGVSWAPFGEMQPLYLPLKGRQLDLDSTGRVRIWDCLPPDALKKAPLYPTPPLQPLCHLAALPLLGHISLLLLTHVFFSWYPALYRAPNFGAPLGPLELRRAEIPFSHYSPSLPLPLLLPA